MNNRKIDFCPIKRLFFDYVFFKEKLTFELRRNEIDQIYEIAQFQAIFVKVFFFKKRNTNLAKYHWQRYFCSTKNTTKN